ncbi:MAG: PKD domain-containing protein, partial [Thermoplasmatales archaeon]
TRERPSDNKAPIAVAGGPYIGELDKSITFNSSGSYDPDGVIHYYRWNFGDDTSEIMAQTPSHTYEANKITPGEITVTLTVIDDYGESSTDYATLKLLDTSTQSPIAFAGTQYVGEINSVITFNAAGSSDPDGEIINYTWDFKDGTIKYGSVVSHIYAVKGNYIVELTVKDDSGLTDSSIATVTISAPKDESPGFEALIFVIALMISILIIKKTKKR